MNKRGPKPKPTPLKILSGMRPQRVNPNEPQPVPGVPDCPADLTALGRAKWDHLCSVLQRMGILSISDADALHIYCVTFERWMLARIDIKKTGMTVPTPGGGIKSNPSVTIEALSSRMMLSILLQFGLTPSARSQIRLGGAADARGDDLDAFIRSKPG